MISFFIFICRLISRLKGWKYEFELPEDLKKGVIIVAPHTSNWDFVYAMGGYHLLNFKMNYFGKKQLFRWPIKGWLEKTGGIPVERVKNENWVENAAKQIRESEEIFITIAPEGTRSYVDRWRTGFYHIARLAEVPIIFAYIDYGKRVAAIDEVFYPTGEQEKDFEHIRNYYRDKVPKHEKFWNVEFV